MAGRGGAGLAAPLHDPQARGRPRHDSGTLPRDCPVHIGTPHGTVSSGGPSSPIALPQSLPPSQAHVSWFEEYFVNE